MAHWNEAAVTDSGIELLNEWMAGRTLTITAAYGGSGTVDEGELPEQTELINPMQELYILGEEDGAEGKTVQLQVQNASVMESYTLNQVGVYAALDVDRDKETEQEIKSRSRLLFLMQDQDGVTVPSALDASYLLELYCEIGITNNGRFDVSISSAGIVTTAYLRDALNKAIAAHNTDITAHPDLRSMIQETGNMETEITNLDSRLSLLELMYRTNVSGNPFSVTFSDLSDVTATGVYNASQKRIEF